MKPGTLERIYPSLGDDYKNPGILLIFRLAMSAALLGVFNFVELSKNIDLVLLSAAALVSGYDVLINAVKDISHRVLMRENLPVLIAVILSFAIGRGAEGVIALLLLQLSYMARDYALYRTRKMICEAIEPDRRILKGAETNPKGEPQKLEYPIGSTVIVYEGMAVPLDCVIKEGSGCADMSFITGSPKKVKLVKGDYLPAGSVCTEGQFVAEASQLPENALYRKIASVLKSDYGEMTEIEERLIRATGFFIPAALAASVVLLLVLPFAYKIDFMETIRRIITIIAVASPCGVLLSIPLTWFSGMAAGRRKGILFTHAKALENSAVMKTIVFNKAGTLTDRNFLVTEIKTDRMDPATFLKVAAYAAANSKNSLARAIVKAFGEEIDTRLVKEFAEYPEKGVSVTVDGIQIMLGIGSFFSENGVAIPERADEGTKVHMAVNGIYAGWISLSETVKQDVSIGYFNSLSKAGIDRVAMISGDSREKDRLVANELGIEEYYAECSNEEKLRRIAEIKGRTERRSTLAYVSDCLSGEKLFKAADVGILTDGITCRDELTKTDIVIMENGVAPLPDVIRISRRTKSYIIKGAIFGCCVKVIILALAVFGFAPVWFGLLIDFCASLAVLLNSTGVYSRDTVA